MLNLKSLNLNPDEIVSLYNSCMDKKKSLNDTYYSLLDYIYQWEMEHARISGHRNELYAISHEIDTTEKLMCHLDYLYVHLTNSHLEKEDVE